MSCNIIETPDDVIDKGEITDTLTNNKETEDTTLILPQSIVLLDKEVKIKHGYTADIEFRVNPSNADVDFESFKLDLISTETRLSSYITEPANLRLKRVRYSQENKLNLRGQYILTIEDKNICTDYCERVAIVYDTRDENERKVEISSDVLTVTPEYPSELPRVYINTPGGAKITSKTEWLEDSSIRITDKDGNLLFDAFTSIRGRGNSTWGYPKKPYALKLDSKAEILGMPKHKRWVLLANWMDRTLLRNAVSFEMGRRVMNWAPRGEFVELYLNDKHQGNYYLCEQIKPDKNRVNIDEKNGGYILEFDTYGPYDEINYFYTPINNYPVTIKEPDEELITSWEHEGFTYISNHLGDFEKMLEDDKSGLNKWSEIESLIDVTSYIDWWLIHELTYNLEPLHPKSCYMHKKENDKLFAGPVWDFDYGTFANTRGIIVNNSLWYGYLFKYPEFKEAVKQRWAEVKHIFEEIDSYIVTQSEYIRESNEVNIYKWPTTASTNKDEHLSYDSAITVMRKSYQLRLSVVDEYISKL